MNLTGQCKEDFEEWFLLRKKYHYTANYLLAMEGAKATMLDSTEMRIDLKLFICYEPAMQWGVYQDFFDSVGYEIEVKRHSNDKWVFKIYFEQGHYDFTLFKSHKFGINTRIKARTAAIERAKDLYNEKQ